jgi:hypothetical protein
MVSEVTADGSILMRCLAPDCGRRVAVRTSDVFIVVETGDEVAFHRYTYGQKPEGGVMQPVDAVA